MAMVFFQKWCDNDVFWIHGAIAYGAIIKTNLLQVLLAKFCPSWEWGLQIDSQKNYPILSMWLLSLSNHNITFELTLIQLSFNLEDHTISDWRLNWKSNGKSSRKIFAGCNSAPQLQPVPVLERNSYQSQEAHAETFGRKAFQVQSM